MFHLPANLKRHIGVKGRLDTPALRQLLYYRIIYAADFKTNSITLHIK